MKSVRTGMCTATVASSTTEPAPAAGGRVEAVDALRGFALGGILLMNIEFYTRPLQGMALGFDPQWQGLDRFAGWFVAAFVQGKFWTLFSLLFGMGFAVLLERAEAARVSFDAIYARRLLVLLAIGVAHSTLAWAGDILVPYAITGFALWVLHRLIPREQLWRVGLLLYALPMLLVWLSVFALGALPAGGQEIADQSAQAAQALRDDYQAAARVYAEGTYREVVGQRIDDSLMQYGWFGSILPAILGMFLIGAWLHSSGVLRDPASHRAFFRNAFVVSFPAGLVLATWSARRLASADMTVLDAPLALWLTASMLGNLALCAAWGSAFLLLAMRPGSRVAAWLAPAGRMALTNYLMQSIAFTTLFYGYGAGLWGTVPRAMQVLLALAFFALQVLWSRVWMARFHLGPLEWLWRALTYLQLPAMRR